MFQFRRFPTYTYFVQCRFLEYCSRGFPHSEILGSKLMCSSPRLIAACHVLHRLLMPRHSPCALYSLTNQKQIFTCSRCELCRLHKDLEIVIVTLHPFGCCSTIKFAFSIPKYGNLSVALLHFSITLFSFQGAVFRPHLKSD